jgi:hypothetical protein
VVETVEIMFDPRPSTLASACVPSFGVVAAVPAIVRTSPTFGIGISGSTTSKINYMGTIGSQAEGAVMTAAVKQTKALVATGGNARGIPPRGTPV